MHPRARRTPAANTASARSSSAASGSWSSTPIRHFTVTGTATAALHRRDAFARPAPASASGRRRSVPDCTRSDGQPTLRLISSIAESLADRAPPRRASPGRSRRAAAPPDARPDRSRAAARGRPWITASASPSRCRAARGASAGDGRTGNAGPSSPSWAPRPLYVFDLASFIEIFKLVSSRRVQTKWPSPKLLRALAKPDSEVVAAVDLVDDLTGLHPRTPSSSRGRPGHELANIRNAGLALGKRPG